MNEILSDFLKRAEDTSAVLSLDDALSEEELFHYETLVKAFDSIDVMNVGRDLKKIHKTYKLERWQEMSILAYVKILEMMIRRAKESGAMDMMDDIKPTTKTNKTEYDGSMFG